MSNSNRSAWIVVGWVLLACACLSQAQVPMTGAGLGRPGAVVACSATTANTNFIARTSGLDATHLAAYKCLFDDLTIASIFDGAGNSATLDFLHIYATQDQTTALLNTVGISNVYTFDGVANGSPNFVADSGFLGVDASTTVYIDPAFNVGSGSKKFQRNSAHMSAWSLTNAASGAAGGVVMGYEDAAGSGNQAYIYPQYIDGNSYSRVNGGSGVGSDVAYVQSDSRGHFLVSRVANGANMTSYQNNSPHGPTGTSTAALPSAFIVILAAYATGGVGVKDGGGYRLAMASAGAGMDATQATAYYNALRRYMTAVGVP